MSDRSMLVLVVGATGSIGRLVVEEAVRRGHKVRALVRDPRRSDRLPSGVDVVVGDVTRPETLTPAVEGVDAIVLTLGLDGGGRVGAENVDYGSVRNILQAIAPKRARIALMTSIGVTEREGRYNRTTEADDWKRRSERLVRASGLPYTIVRPGWFDYNSPDQQRIVLLQGDRRHAGDSSDGVIARRQIAQVLVESLSFPEAVRKTFELVAETGPAPDDFDALFARLDADPGGHPRRSARSAEHAACGGAQEGQGRSGTRVRSPPEGIGRSWSGRRRSTAFNPRKEPVMINVTVVIGAGSIGQAIARRVSAGKHVLLADLRPENADAAAKVLSEAGYEVSTATVDVSSRESVHKLVETATAIGQVTGVIHAAGVSPSQAPPAVILKVDLYGTALVLEEFGNVIAAEGSCVVIASMSGHRLPALTAEQDRALATTPVDDLLSLAMLQPQQVTDPRHAYQISKRGNSLRVMAEAVRWGKRGARVNTISPGIIITPLAKDELTGPRGAGYRRMIDLCPTGRAGTPDEVGTLGALLMGPDGAFITGSDFLMDGGVTASYRHGELAPN